MFLAAAGSLIGLAGAGVQAAGTIGAAKANEAAAKQQWWVDYNAAIMDQKRFKMQADEERFAGQQRAIQAEQGKELALSKLRAGAAFSGGSATDNNAIQLGGDIEHVGTYQRAMNMYASESRARGLEDEGTAGIYRAVNRGNMNLWRAQMNTSAARASSIGSLIGASGGLFSALRGFDGGSSNYGYG